MSQQKTFNATPSQQQKNPHHFASSHQERQRSVNVVRLPTGTTSQESVPQHHHNLPIRRSGSRMSYSQLHQLHSHSYTGSTPSTIGRNDDQDEAPLTAYQKQYAAHVNRPVLAEWMLQYMGERSARSIGDICTDKFFSGTAVIEAVTDIQIRCMKCIGDNVWIGEKTGCISIWDAKNGSLIQRTEHKRDIFPWAILDVGYYVWIGFSDGLIRVFERGTMQLLKEVKEHVGGILALHDFLNGNVVFSASSDFTINQWDAMNCERLSTLNGHTNQVRCLHINGNRVFSGSDDHTIIEWDVFRSCIKNLMKGHERGVTCVTSSTQYLWSGSEDGSVRIWSLTAGGTEANMNAPRSTAGDVNTTNGSVEANISPARTSTTAQDRKSSSSVATTNNLYGTLPCVHLIRDPHVGAITTLKSVGAMMWSTARATLFVWDADTFNLEGSFREHRGYIAAVECVHQSAVARIWTAGADGKLAIWNAESSWERAQKVTESKEVHSLEKSIFESAERETDLRCENRELQTELNKIRNDIEPLQYAVVGLKEKLGAKDEKISSLEEQLENLTLEIGVKNKQNEELQQKLTEAEGIDEREKNWKKNLQEGYRKPIENIEKLQILCDELQVFMQSVKQKRSEAILMTSSTQDEIRKDQERTTKEIESHRQLVLTSLSAAAYGSNAVALKISSLQQELFLMRMRLACVSAVNVQQQQPLENKTTDCDTTSSPPPLVEGGGSGGIMTGEENGSTPTIHVKSLHVLNKKEQDLFLSLQQLQKRASGSKKLATTTNTSSNKSSSVGEEVINLTTSYLTSFKKDFASTGPHEAEEDDEPIIVLSKGSTGPMISIAGCGEIAMPFSTTQQQHNSSSQQEKLGYFALQESLLKKRARMASRRAQLDRESNAVLKKWARQHGVIAVGGEDYGSCLGYITKDELSMADAVRVQQMEAQYLSELGSRVVQSTSSKSSVGERNEVQGEEEQRAKITMAVALTLPPLRYLSTVDFIFLRDLVEKHRLIKGQQRTTTTMEEKRQSSKKKDGPVDGNVDLSGEAFCLDQDVPSVVSFPLLTLQCEAMDRLTSLFRREKQWQSLTQHWKKLYEKIVSLVSRLGQQLVECLEDPTNRAVVGERGGEEETSKNSTFPQKYHQLLMKELFEVSREIDDDSGDRSSPQRSQMLATSESPSASLKPVAQVFLKLCHVMNEDRQALENVATSFISQKEELLEKDDVEEENGKKKNVEMIDPVENGNKALLEWMEQIQESLPKQQPQFAVDKNKKNAQNTSSEETQEGSHRRLAACRAGQCVRSVAEMSCEQQKNFNRRIRQLEAENIRLQEEILQLASGGENIATQKTDERKNKTHPYYSSTSRNQAPRIGKTSMTEEEEDNTESVHGMVSRKRMIQDLERQLRELRRSQSNNDDDDDDNDEKKNVNEKKNPPTKGDEEGKKKREEEKNDDVWKEELHLADDKEELLMKNVDLDAPDAAQRLSDRNKRIVAENSRLRKYLRKVMNEKEKRNDEGKEGEEKNDSNSQGGHVTSLEQKETQTVESLPTDTDGEPGEGGSESEKQKKHGPQEEVDSKENETEEVEKFLDGEERRRFVETLQDERRENELLLEENKNLKRKLNHQLQAVPSDEAEVEATTTSRSANTKNDDIKEFKLDENEKDQPEKQPETQKDQPEPTPAVTKGAPPSNPLLKRIESLLQENKELKEELSRVKSHQETAAIETENAQVVEDERSYHTSPTKEHVSSPTAAAVNEAELQDEIQRLRKQLLEMESAMKNEEQETEGKESTAKKESSEEEKSRESEKEKQGGGSQQNPEQTSTTSTTKRTVPSNPLLKRIESLLQENNELKEEVARLKNSSMAHSEANPKEHQQVEKGETEQTTSRAAPTSNNNDDIKEFKLDDEKDKPEKQLVSSETQTDLAKSVENAEQQQKTAESSNTPRDTTNEQPNIDVEKLKADVAALQKENSELQSTIEILLKQTPKTSSSETSSATTEQKKQRQQKDEESEKKEEKDKEEKNKEEKDKEEKDKEEKDKQLGEKVSVDQQEEIAKVRQQLSDSDDEVHRLRLLVMKLEGKEEGTKEGGKTTPKKDQEEKDAETTNTKEHPAQVTKVPTQQAENSTTSFQPFYLTLLLRSIEEKKDKKEESGGAEKQSAATTSNQKERRETEETSNAEKEKSGGKEREKEEEATTTQQPQGNISTESEPSPADTTNSSTVPPNQNISVLKEEIEILKKELQQLVEANRELSEALSAREKEIQEMRKREALLFAPMASDSASEVSSATGSATQKPGGKTAATTNKSGTGGGQKLSSTSLQIHSDEYVQLLRQSNEELQQERAELRVRLAELKKNPYLKARESDRSLVDELHENKIKAEEDMEQKRKEFDLEREREIQKFQELVRQMQEDLAVAKSAKGSSEPQQLLRKLRSLEQEMNERRALFEEETLGRSVMHGSAGGGGATKTNAEEVLDYLAEREKQWTEISKINQKLHEINSQLITESGGLAKKLQMLSYVFETRPTLARALYKIFKILDMLPKILDEHRRLADQRQASREEAKARIREVKVEVEEAREGNRWVLSNLFTAFEIAHLGASPTMFRPDGMRPGWRDVCLPERLGRMWAFSSTPEGSEERQASTSPGQGGTTTTTTAIQSTHYDRSVSNESHQLVEFPPRRATTTTSTTAQNNPLAENATSNYFSRRGGGAGDQQQQLYMQTPRGSRPNVPMTLAQFRSRSKEKKDKGGK